MKEPNLSDRSDMKREIFSHNIYHTLCSQVFGKSSFRAVLGREDRWERVEKWAAGEGLRTKISCEAEERVWNWQVWDQRSVLFTCRIPQHF